MVTKTYRGQYQDGARVVHVYYESGVKHPLDPRRDLAEHSPIGLEFGWGFGGAGAMQLAVALLADVLGDDVARLLAGDFCQEVIARLPHNHAASGWCLTAAEIQRWAEQARTRPARPAA